MSEARRVSSRELTGPPGKVSVWQRDELLLIFKSTNRCLPLEDIARFVSLLEDILPSDRIIKFQAVSSVSRQLEQMLRSELIERMGNCYRITEKGAKLADEAELSMEHDEELEKVWQTIRGALSSLPWSKLMWDSHLFSALRQPKDQ